MGHLYSTESLDELFDFAVGKMKLKPEWNHLGRYFPHFDLTTKRANARATELGAFLVDVLVISAKQGGGKTTIADKVKEMSSLHGYDIAMIIKFAGVLYTMHDAVLHLLEESTGIPRVAKDGRLLQLLGTEWG